MPANDLYGQKDAFSAMALKSAEVNFLIHRYLLESGESLFDIVNDISRRGVCEAFAQAKCC